MSIYLLFAIGFKGGVGVVPTVLMQSFSGHFLLRPFCHLAGHFWPALLGALPSLPDKAAVAAHYGSISIVTFVAASWFRKQGLIAEGYMVAAAAVMEAPAFRLPYGLSRDPVSGLATPASIAKSC